MRFARRCQPAGWAQCGAAGFVAASAFDASTLALLPPHPEATSASMVETPASVAKALIAAMVDGLPQIRFPACRRLPPRSAPLPPGGPTRFQRYRQSAHETVTETRKERENLSPTPRLRRLRRRGAPTRRARRRGREAPAPRRSPPA